MTNFEFYDAQEWRDSELWTLDVQDVFHANLGHIHSLYMLYNEKQRKVLEMKGCN